MSCDIQRYWFGQSKFLGKIYVETCVVANRPKLCHIECVDGEYLIWVGPLHIIYTPPNWRVRHDIDTD